LYGQVSSYRQSGELCRALDLSTEVVDEAVRAGLPIHLAGAV
jgi:hypothetical protein